MFARILVETFNSYLLGVLFNVMVSNWMRICDGIEIRYLFLDENAFHNGKLKIIQL